MERAKKAKRGNYAVLLPAQVFGAVDEYFGMQTDEEAQERAMMAACGRPERRRRRRPRRRWP